MFSPAEKCSVNHRDNSAISQSDVNCHTAIAKRSFAPSAAAVACASKRNLRKCKSDSNVGRRHSEIDRMGLTISRSKSCDNIETDSIVYESLTKNKKVDEKSLCSFGDSDEDYKLLESSENDESDSGEEDDDSGCVTKTIELDGHDASPILASNNINNDCMQQTPRAGNEIENDLLCEKYSTLPRVKFKKGVLDRDRFSRCSAPYKSFDNRAHCSKEEIMSEFRVVSDGRSETAKVSDTLEAPIQSDKLDNVTSSPLPSFRSTTLPKTRSRQSEPHFRHSLRQAIDLTMPRKHLRISDASEHNVVISPGSETTRALGTGMGKTKNTF